MSEVMWRKWDATEDPTTMKAFAEALERAAAKGIDEDEAIEKLLDAYEKGVGRAMESVGDSMAATLQATAPAMLAQHRQMRRDFEYRLDWVWGEGLDLLYQVLVCCEEMGE